MGEARIFQPAKNSMQSCRSNSRAWVLEFEPAERRWTDPLMGWIGSCDTQAQVHLQFANREEATAYADNHGLHYQIEEPRRRRFKAKNYTDNFSYWFRFE
jgi:hypothetical protein